MQRKKIESARSVITKNHRRIIWAAIVWTCYVWTTRIWNILRDSEWSFGFKVVHSVLAFVSISFAVGLFVVLRRSDTVGREANR